MLEPHPGQERMQLAPAPPVVELVDEHAMIGLDRATEPDVARGLVGHRATSPAATTPAANWSGTSSPNTSPR